MVSAVQRSWCMMIRKEIYQNAGGLDEKSFKVAFNDVDFCLRVEKFHYFRNLWTPFAELVHHRNQHLGVMITRLPKKAAFRELIVSLKKKLDVSNHTMM